AGSAGTGGPRCGSPTASRGWKQREDQHPRTGNHADRRLPTEDTMTPEQIKPKAPTEALPRPASQLNDLASYYDTNDTSTEMEDGTWVDLRPDSSPRKSTP